MPALDFKEIPRANVSSGQQDTFELFARDFLELLGYQIRTGPDRGSDLGRDLVVLESRPGIAGETIVNWLVSCKHLAHSGRSVGLTDEQDIYDRVQTHSCAGFMGFYSTLPSTSLTEKLDGIIKSNQSFQYQILDRERLEGNLLSSGPGQEIAQRYFPTSYNKWRKENFDIALAMARFGMPQPVAYKFPGEDKVLTVEEVTSLYPQGNQYIFDVFMPEPGFIFCNNIFGITKILRNGQSIDPTPEYLEQRAERITRELEFMAQQRFQARKEKENSAATRLTESTNTTKKKRSSKQQIGKKSRRHKRRN